MMLKLMNFIFLLCNIRRLRPPGPPVSAQHWVEFLEHFYPAFAPIFQIKSEKSGQTRTSKSEDLQN